MSRVISPLAGKPADPLLLIDPGAIVEAYFERVPDPSRPEERVAFGTSGHRGSPLRTTFNEAHVLAISQAISEYRRRQGIDGPLFLGADTHAVSAPAFETALEVLAANAVEVRVSAGGEFTPTPAVSHAILACNRGRRSGPADGIVITPSHNPPEDGGFKYDPPEGGPADSRVTSWIERRANELLESGLAGVPRMPLARALNSPTTRRHDFLGGYVEDLGGVIAMDVVRGSGVRLGVDPLGGASVHYWDRVAERYGLSLRIVSDAVDPAFGFMTVDWDGRIRTDPSSPYAMGRLIGLKDRFDVAVACDADADRHGIVTASEGLLSPNHYLAAAVDYLFSHRPGWGPGPAVGTTIATSRVVERAAARLGRRLIDMPVGFKWFVPGLLDGSLGFAGEESAGASFLRLDGTVWTTDKDGIVPALLAAEMTGRLGRDPGEVYRALAGEVGGSVYDRIEIPATAGQKKILAELAPGDVRRAELAGERISAVLTKAPGNGAPIGGLKVVAPSGWFAVRPSGTEDICKIYAESFLGEDHLKRIIIEAQAVVAETLAAGPRGPGREGVPS